MEQTQSKRQSSHVTSCEVMPAQRLATTTPPTSPLGAPHEGGADKRDWHSAVDMGARRRVLLHILMIFKNKYGTIDAKVSMIARRAELALYSRAFSAREFSNPKTLSRRLHALVIKLHLNNLAPKEDELLSQQYALQHYSTRAPKRSVTEAEDSIAYRPQSLKRRRVERKPTSCSLLFMNGNADLVQHLCSFLDARAVLRTAATCKQAHDQLPAFVTKIVLSPSALLCVPVDLLSRFFSRFRNLQTFELLGDASVQPLDFQNDDVVLERNVVSRSLLHSLRAASLLKLQRFALNHAFTESLHDRITAEVASCVLDASRFPQLQSLSLRGNCISDDGVQHLYVALSSAPQAFAQRFRDLDLTQNYIGERGQRQLLDLQQRVGSTHEAGMVIHLEQNLLA